MTYRMEAFKSATSGMSSDIPFACNCVLNYQYVKLEGARAGLPGTMVCFDVVDVRKGIAERMAAAH